MGYKFNAMRQLLIAFTLLAGFGVHAQTANLYEAARKGDVTAAERILSETPEAINLENEAGYTPLVLACYHNQVPFVQFLLEHDANPNVEAGQSSPLQGACYKGYTQVASLLLEAGADPNTPDGNGMTPLHYAAQFNHMELVTLLLEGGADINAIDANSRKPIDYAQLLGHSEIIGLLSAAE